MRSVTLILLSLALWSACARNLHQDIERLDEALMGVQADLTEMIGDEGKEVTVQKRDAARVLIVDGSLADTADIKNGPFKTIGECVEELANPGDKCQVKKGHYHEDTIRISGLRGTKANPIVIEAFGDDRPVIDGTEILTFKKEDGGVNEDWDDWDNDDAPEDGNAYVATYTGGDDFWQLFYDEDGDDGVKERVMLTNARWPNAPWDESKVDNPIFDGKRWAYVDKTSKVQGKTQKDEDRVGTIVVANNQLGNANLNVEGAMAILNIGSFNTFISKVKTQDKNEFTYDHTFGKVHYKWKKSRFFLEDKLNLLDEEREWFYEKGTNKLYVWLPKDAEPLTGQLRGKTQTYAFEVRDSWHLTFRNLDFFATTLKANSESWEHYIDNINIEHCNFKFPSYSKRMLQASNLKTSHFAIPEWTVLDGVTNTVKQEQWRKFRLYDNTFYGSDGVALEYSGKEVEIENNLFEYNDWTAANMDRAMGGKGTVSVPHSVGDTYLRNTFRYNGASVGIRPGLKSTVQLNYITKQCWMVIMNDGAGVQLQKKQQVDAKLTHNWVLDQPKYGLRFDGEPNPAKGCDPGKGFTDGTMEYNVVGRCNGMMVKGLSHTAEYNLVFQKQNEKDDDKQGKCALCVLKQVRKNTCPINQGTTTKNNVADVANGGKPTWDIPNNAYDPVNNNHFWNKARDASEGLLSSQEPGFVQLFYMDPDHNDFRPIQSKVAELNGAGPYEYETTKTKYWIPGRQVHRASMPIPPDGAGSGNDQLGNPKPKVNAGHRDALMWLNALDATSHKVYFCRGVSCSPAFLIEKFGENNVASLASKSIVAGKTYKWRVDAHYAGGHVAQGEDWLFHT